MEEAPPLYTDNIKLKQLSTELYLRISNNYPTATSSHLSLLAVSSKHAYLVAATEAGFLYAHTDQVRKAARTGKNNCIPIPPHATALVNTTHQPSHIRISADNSTVFVVFPTASVHFYSATQLEASIGKNLHLDPLKQINLQKNILDIRPNPHDRPDTFAVLFQDGTVSLVNTDAAILTTFSSEFITSICWSPKGKQISCGLKSGKVEQRDIQGTLKNSFAKPSTLADKHMIVQNILWVENTVFVVAYAVPLNRNAEDAEHDVAMYVVTTDKTRGTVYRDLVDYPAGPYGARTREANYYLEYIRKWDHINHLVFVANSPSNDVGMIGNDENGWATWIPNDETDCITLPLPSNCDDQNTENFPVGLALDLSANEPLPPLNMSESTEPSDPVPVLMVLTGDGVLACYNVMNITAIEKKIRCEEMVSNPTSLADEIPKPSIGSVPPPAGAFSLQPSSFAPTAQQRSPLTSVPPASEKSGTVSSSTFSVQQPPPTPSVPPAAQVSAFASPIPSATAQAPAFGKPSTLGTIGSVFGATSTLGGTGSTFGAPGTFGSALTPATAVFGAPSTVGNASTLGGTGSTFGAPGTFGSALKPGTVGSVFGAPSTFGNATTLGGTGSGFGAPSTSANASTFEGTGSGIGAPSTLGFAKPCGPFAPPTMNSPGLFAPPSASTGKQPSASAPSTTAAATPAPAVKKETAQPPPTTVAKPTQPLAAQPPTAKPTQPQPRTAAQAPPAKPTQPNVAPPVTTAKTSVATTSQPPVTTTAHKIAQEFENTYREFQAELDALKSNVRASEAIVSRLTAPSKRDVNSPKTWTMGDLKTIGTVSKEGTETLQLFVQKASAEKIRAETISEELVTASSKDAEIKNYLEALKNEKFQRSIKARKLGPEQAECQMRLRSKTELVGKKLEELQDQICHVRQTNAAHASGKRANLKAPSLDTIHRTITNISGTARGINSDLEQVEEQVRRLGIKSRASNLSSSSRGRSVFENQEILSDSRMDAVVVREGFLRRLSESLRTGCRTAPLNESIVREVVRENTNPAGPVSAWFETSERSVVIAGAVAPTLAISPKGPETQESKERSVSPQRKQEPEKTETEQRFRGLFPPSSLETPTSTPKTAPPSFKQVSPTPKPPVAGLFANVTPPPMRETSDEMSDAEVEAESEEERALDDEYVQDDEESQTEGENDSDQYEDLEGEYEDYEDLGQEDEDRSLEEEEEQREEEEEDDSKKQRMTLPPQTSAFHLFSNVNNSLSAFGGASPEHKNAFTGKFEGTAGSFEKSALEAPKTFFSFAPPPASESEKVREGTVEPSGAKVETGSISFGTPSSAFAGNKPLSFGMPASEAPAAPVKSGFSGFSFAPKEQVSNPTTNVSGTGPQEESSTPSASPEKSSAFKLESSQVLPVAESSLPIVSFTTENVEPAQVTDEGIIPEEEKETVEEEKNDESETPSTSEDRERKAEATAEATERGESPFEILESGDEGNREREASVVENAEVSREEGGQEQEGSGREEGSARLESLEGDHEGQVVSSSESEGEEEEEGGAADEPEEDGENEEEESSQVEYLEEFRVSPTREGEEEEKGEDEDDDAEEEEEEEEEEKSQVEDLSEIVPSEESREPVVEEEQSSVTISDEVSTTTATNELGSFTICSPSPEVSFGGGNRGGMFGTAAPSAFAGFGAQSSFSPSPPSNNGMDEGDGGDAMTDDDVRVAANVAPGFGGFGLGGPGTTQGKTSIYGTPFNNPPASFGSPVSGFGAAAANPSQPSFGAPSSGFLAPATAFGKSLNASPSPSFGTSSGGFLAAPTGFGKSLASTPSAFGSNSFGGGGGFLNQQQQQQQGGFGSSGFGGGFGNASPSTGFGTSTTPASGVAFGQPSALGSSAFGQTSTLGSTAFGGGGNVPAFGKPSALGMSSSGFGQAGSTFGAAANTSGTSFASLSNNATGFGTGSSGFAGFADPNRNQGFGSFGSGSGSAAGGGGGGFGTMTGGFGSNTNSNVFGGGSSGSGVPKNSSAFTGYRG